MNQEQKNKASKEWRAKNPEYHRRYDLKLRYGITEEYDELFKAQNGVCAICKKPPKIENRLLCVDHDHENGWIRGLLCDSCNNGLGRFDENPKLLRRAAKYLEDRL